MRNSFSGCITTYHKFHSFNQYLFTLSQLGESKIQVELTCFSLFMKPKSDIEMWLRWTFFWIPLSKRDMFTLKLMQVLGRFIFSLFVYLSNLLLNYQAKVSVISEQIFLVLCNSTSCGHSLYLEIRWNQSPASSLWFPWCWTNDKISLIQRTNYFFKVTLTSPLCKHRSWIKIIKNKSKQNDSWWYTHRLEPSPNFFKEVSSTHRWEQLHRAITTFYVELREYCRSWGNSGS